jgi:hypothetical protein
MSEEILGLDEVEKIAKEYVRHKENVSAVEVTGTELSSVGGLLVHVVQGKAMRHTAVDPTTWRVGVSEERAFSLQISNKDRNIIGYKPDDWRKTSEEQAPSVSYQPEQIIVEPVEFLGIRDPYERFGIHPESPIDDMLDRQADRDLKKSRTELNKEEADFLREAKKKVRDRREREELLKKYGFDGKKSKELRDKLGW